jgi:hypothetical protein
MGEGIRLPFHIPLISRDPLGALEVREQKHVEQFGAGSRGEGVETFAEPAFEYIGPHGRRLRRSTVIPFVGPRYIPEHSRTPAASVRRAR